MGTKRDLDSQAILNAAVELAEERGLENISLLQVAERLGVKPPSLLPVLCISAPSPCWRW